MFLALTILSLLLLVGFVFLSCILNHGIPSSYSELSEVWKNDPPKLNTWSVVTFIVAFLMVPPMIEAGVDDPLQFLGFFAPVYLIVVALTPDWASDKRQHIWHEIGAGLCAVMACLWLILVRGHAAVLIVCFIAALIAGFSTKTMRRSAVFWLEATLFISVYVSLFWG